MPLHVGAYVGDTMHLSTVEHGAYLLLLMHYWRSGPLPNDDATLANISKTSPYLWRKISPEIRKFFALGGDGFLHQKRADQERKKAREISAKRTKAAITMHEKQASEITGDMAAHAHAHAQQMQVHARARLPLPLPSKKDSEAKASDAENSVLDVIPVRSQLWDEGLDRLQRLTGKHNGNARSLLGKLLKGAKDDCASVLTALRECPETRDPTAWLMASVQHRTGPPALSRADRVLAEFNEAVDRMEATNGD